MMEAETPEAGEPPHADICGVQFGLMTTGEMLKLSVFDPSHSLTKPRELTGPRLGLPTASGPCTTCTASSVDKCQGHFGHMLLPTPIFHPNHVGRLIRLLRKICLNCGRPKKKSARRTPLKNTIEPNKKNGKKSGTTKELSTFRQHPVETNGNLRNKRKFSAFVDEEAETSALIVLSSDEEELSSNGKKGQKTREFLLDDDILGGKASSSSARRSWNGKRKHRGDSSEINSTITPTVVDLTDMLVCVSKPKKSKGLKSKSRSGVEVVDDTFCSSPKDDNFTSEPICLYCSASSQSDRYPEVQLKVDVKEGSRTDMANLAKSIRMEISDKDYKNIAPNYWSFVGGNSSSNERVPITRNLLPSEALKIIRKIPQDALLGLGIQPDLAPPDALIVECLLIPPNCTRLQEDALGAGGTNIGFKIGFDRATLAFTKLLKKISSIKASRFGRPSFHAAGLEASSLQALFGHYLREKGAPKVAPGKEKKRTDHVGRVQKRASRWSLDWLKRNVLGKRSGFSARNVVTGDPFLTVEEIGVPLEVAKYLTYPVRVTRLNQSKLQECVEIGQELGMTRACGAVRIVKNGEKLEVTPKSSHQLEIGDVVHRHLSDGDLVYVNRPPSLHKHSLIALKTRIQDSATFSINPAVCAPLHADFDGDCLHVFVPQSEESKAELHQLLTIPEQILPSLTRKTVIGLSQDNILATHLVTSSPVFVDKDLMHQLAMWSCWKLPVPTIVKAPKGGPLWTGKQIIDITIPDEFSYRNDEGTTIIQNGELLSYGGEANWLASTSGLVSAIARPDPKNAVKHLDCSQAVLREWLLSHGFSVSLKDFYGAPDSSVRSKMKAQILNGLEQAQCTAADKQYLFDRMCQKLETSHSGRNGTSETSRDSGGEVSKDADDERVSDAITKASMNRTDDSLEDVAVTRFLDNFSKIGDQIGEGIGWDNSLLAMVRSGSKGSMAKAFQQIGCLGLQLYKGEHLLALQDNHKLCSVAHAAGYLDKWEARGLVRNSLLDGLEPMEFFLHAIAVRAGLLRQSLEVTEPGELFKRLMLFLRDIHVSYDGTIRNKCGLAIIQFCYEGVKPLECTDSVSMEWNESVMPGEAVGILAATAIAQPAYQVMLEANHSVGSKKIRPLELLQETMFPRSTSSLKASDRRSILRLSECDCGKLYCDERRILHIQCELQPVTVQSMAKRTAIEYIPDTSEEWDAFYVNGERQKLRLPWVGHILLEQIAMMESRFSKEKFLEVLQKKFESHRKVLQKFQLGLPLFCFRDECSCMGVSSEDRQSGPCLHFSPMPKSNVKRRKVKVLKDSTMEMLDVLQNFLIPLIMNTVVKGDDRIESTRIIWEDVAWSPPGRSNMNNNFPDIPCSGELVLEVTVKEKFSSRRGVPWMVMLEACLPIDEVIDWRRSAPYSVQEIKYAFGVEAARHCILQRFNLATQASGNSMGIQHLKLVADLMVHSGEVHGLTSHGYRDLMRSLKTSAPFTAGAFRAPIKNFMEAGEKGAEEVLSGVLASCVFGKRVPVGTGAHFSLKVNGNGMMATTESVDVHEYLKDVISKIVEERSETPPHSEVEIRDVANCTWIHDGHDEDVGRFDTGGWGAHDKNGSTKGASQGGWGGNASGWTSPNKSPSTREMNSVGWSSLDKTALTKEANSDGWEERVNTTGGISSWGDPSVPEVGGAWGVDDQTKSTPVNDIGSGWAAEVAAPAESLKSGGWNNPGRDNAGAWAVDEDIECSSAGGWGWGSSPKGSRPLSSPVVASDGMDDAGVEADHSPRNTLPRVQPCGLREKPSEDVNCSPPMELYSSKGPSRNNTWTTQKKTDATSAAWSSEGLSQTPRHSSWTCEENMVRQKSGSNVRTEVDGSMIEGGREFKATGANTTPLGKARVFKDVLVEPPSLRSLLPPGESVVLTKEDGNQNLPDEPMLTRLDKDHHSFSKSKENSSLSSQPRETLSSESVEKKPEEGGPEFAENSAKEIENASSWMTSDDRGSKDVDSGWSSLTIDSQTVPADRSRGVATDGSKIVPKVFWSPGRRKEDADPSHQLHGKEPQTSGGWPSQRDQKWKRPEMRRDVDLRKESDDWKELETLGRSIRNILKKYEPEDKLEEEDHNLLLTQVLPNHPCSTAKVGCGIDYIKVANHMDTRCFFLVRKDGTSEDFSYHKCLVTLAARKNPLLAERYKGQFMSRRKPEPRALGEAVILTSTSARVTETAGGANVQYEVSGTESQDVQA